MALLVCVPVCISGMLCVDAAGNDHDPAPFFHPVDKLVTVISLVSQNQLTVQGKRFQQRLGHTDIITVSAGEHAGLSRCHHHHLFRTVHEFLLYGNELPPGVGQGPAATVVSALRQGVLLLYLMEALFQLDGPPLAHVATDICSIFISVGCALWFLRREGRTVLRAPSTGQVSNP